MTVYRNDEITLDELIAMRPTQLVVSPGPGELDPIHGLTFDTDQRREQATQILTLASVMMPSDTSRVKYQCWGFVWENRSSTLSLVEE